MVFSRKGDRDRRRSRQLLLDALMGLLPVVVKRKDLGFTPEAREDALMDAILRVLDSEQRPEAPGTAPVDAIARKYALRVIQHQLVDRFRHERRMLERPFFGESAAAPLEDADEAGSTLHRRRREACEAMLEELRQDERSLLEAYLSGTEEFREEYFRQGLQAGAARVRIHRVLQRLRERARSLVA